jgi:hypothetical protein
VTLSQKNTEVFKDKKAKYGDDGFFALAINRLNGIGWASGYETARQARERAIDECRAAPASLDDQPGVPMMARTIMRSPKWKCRVVYQNSP